MKNLQKGEKMPTITGGIVFKQGGSLPQKFIDSMGGKDELIKKSGIKLSDVKKGRVKKSKKSKKK